MSTRVLKHIANFRDFPETENTLLSEDNALLDLASTIGNDSILKGGSNAENAVKDVHELAEATTTYSVPDNAAGEWFYSQQRAYNVNVTKDTKFVKLAGQRITVTNTTTSSIYVYFMFKLENSWGIGDRIHVGAGHTKNV